MSALAPAFSHERYALRESATIRDLAFRELAEYNTIAHIHKKMSFLETLRPFVSII